MISRRRLLFSSAACLVVPYLRTFADQAKPRLCLGVVSDIHIREPGALLDAFSRVLRWFDAQKVDAVMVAGDLADFGMVEQLSLVGTAWDEVFKGDKSSDGRKVEKVFVTGNHDMRFHNHAWIKKKYPDDDERFRRSISFDVKATWANCFHEEYKPIYCKEACGYSLIARNYAECGLRTVLERERSRLDSSRPFFFMQHQHPKNTCYGPLAWGCDNGRDSTDVLSLYPNAVAFSGHSHYSLTDEQSVWQGSFTSIGAGSIKDLCAHYGYENGENPSAGRTEEMPMFRCRERHGLLVKVYDDRMVVERHCFRSSGCPKVGHDWIIPLPSSGHHPFDFECRARTCPVPEFDNAAAIALCRVDGVNRKQEKHRQVILKFPAATAGVGRVFDYEVKVLVGDVVQHVRRVLSPTFAGRPEDDRGVVTCVFAENEIPHGAKFVVVPRNSFGREGGSLMAEDWCKL